MYDYKEKDNFTKIINSIKNCMNGNLIRQFNGDYS